MSINDVQRVKLIVDSWDVVDGRGVLCERSGFGYPATIAQMGPYFQQDPPRVGEFVEAVVSSPGEVTDIVPCERWNFDSKGANPDGDAIASELGKRLHGGRPEIPTAKCLSSLDPDRQYTTVRQPRWEGDNEDDSR
jgi:hypothetical protein